MDIYLIIIIILIAFAVADLAVGVTNDAVNFLNSAAGSKTAPMWVLLIVVSFGVILGAIFLQTLTNLLIAMGWGDAGKWLGFGIVLFALLIVYVSNRRTR